MTGLDPRVRCDIAGGVARITIAQPNKRNAVAPAMWDALAFHFTRASTDPEVRVVVFTGEGAAFCSGSDLEEIDAGTDPGAGLARLRRANRMILAIYNCDKPVIAAVRGPAVGVGWSLALACDLVVAAQSARFSQGFVKVGLMPDGGSIFFLARQLGMFRAKELAFSGRFVSAEEALNLGLVNAVVADDALEEALTKLAGELAVGATLALCLAKRMFRKSLAPSLEAFLEQEEVAQQTVKQSRDFGEGVAAFKERRSPKFVGK
jgi:2-(1,2-epoxy-1,2-dihydrophenyl)acetyl-CoA isomerase